MADMPRDMNQYGVTDEQYHVIKTEIDRMFSKREQCNTEIILSWFLALATLGTGLGLLVANPEAGLDQASKIVGIILALAGPLIAFLIGRHYHKEEDKRIEKTVSDLCIRITQVVFKGKSIRVTRETFKSGTAYVEGEFVEKTRRGQTIFLFEMAGVKVMPPPPPSLLKKIMDVPDLYADDPDHERRRTRNERGSLSTADPGGIKVTVVPGDAVGADEKHGGSGMAGLAGVLGNTSANTGSTTKRAPPKPTAAVAYFFGLTPPKMPVPAGGTVSAAGAAAAPAPKIDTAVASSSPPGGNSLLSPESRARDKSHWIPDHEVSNCEKCSKPFTLTLRRHHCRICGHIFCASCSSRSVESQRACDSCFVHAMKVAEAQETYRLQQALAANDDERAPPPPPAEADDEPPLAAPIVVAPFDSGQPIVVNPLLLSLAPVSRKPTLESSQSAAAMAVASPTPVPVPAPARAAPPVASSAVLATLHGRAPSAVLKGLNLPAIPTAHKKAPSLAPAPIVTAPTSGGGTASNLRVISEAEPDSPPPPPPGADVELSVAPALVAATAAAATTPKSNTSTSPRSGGPPRPPSSIIAIMGLKPASPRAAAVPSAPAAATTPLAPNRSAGSLASLLGNTRPSDPPAPTQ